MSIKDEYIFLICLQNVFFFLQAKELWILNNYALFKIFCQYKSIWTALALKKSVHILTQDMTKLQV